jgi:1,2-diacylglycerol 3-alpha-glucosyltransferase
LHLLKIAMFTNTFSPHIGGVAYSVAWLANDLRLQGHQVLIVAPEFEGAPPGEADVVRVPALQNFAGSDFSVPIVLSRRMFSRIEQFEPDIVHSHHPFLLGGMALRVSAALDVPIIYTYHTRYELYSHYVSQDSPALKRAALNLALGYCDLCDAVVAPSESIAAFLAEQGVTAPVTVIPTGIDPAKFQNGDRLRMRAELGIPSGAFVIGHVGRLAPEKNLEFLTGTLAAYVSAHASAHVVVAGQGPLTDHMRSAFDEIGHAANLHMLGPVTGGRLADVYASMDVFAFSSHSETQGLVLAEAMAAGVPVAALDAPGAREMVSDGRNGRLLPADASAAQFCDALIWVANSPPARMQSLQTAARRTSKRFSHTISTRRMLRLYQARIALKAANKTVQPSLWQTAKREIEEEWKIFRNVAQAVGGAVVSSVLPGGG